MHKNLASYGLLIVTVLLLSMWSVAPVAGIPLAQINPTEQQGTVDALVNERFTATAIVRTENPATTTATFLPTQTAIPTLTLPPTFTPIGQTSDDSGRIVPTNEGNLGGEAIELYEDAWVNIIEENFHSARRIFTELVELKPTWAEGYVGRGVANLATGRFEDAEEDLSRAIELIGEVEVGILSSRILVYLNLEDYRSAIRDGEAILLSLPSHSGGIENLVLAFQERGWHEDAIEAATIGLRYTIDDITLYDLRKDSYDEINDRDNVRFNRFMSSGIGAFFIDGDNDRAIDFFDNAIELAPRGSISDFDLSLAYLNKAWLLFTEDEFDEALELTEEAERLDANIGSIYWIQAFVHLNTDDNFDSAFDVLEYGIETVPDYPSNYITHAFLFEISGNGEAALNDHWQWLQLIQSRLISWPSADLSGDPFSLMFGYGWQYTIPIDAQNGDRLTVHARGQSLENSNVDPILLLLDPTGEPILSNDNESFGETSARIINFQIPTDGTYTLIVGHSSDGRFGLAEVDIELR